VIEAEKIQNPAPLPWGRGIRGGGKKTIPLTVILSPEGRGEGTPSPLVGKERKEVDSFTH
jgi:hypothetical protein